MLVYWWVHIYEQKAAGTNEPNQKKYYEDFLAVVL